MSKAAMNRAYNYRSESGIDRLTFKSEHAEDALVYPAKRFLANETF